MADLKVYTLNEVADILKVTKRTLYNYIKAGVLPAVKMGNIGELQKKICKPLCQKIHPLLKTTNITKPKAGVKAQVPQIYISGS